MKRKIILLSILAITAIASCVYWPSLWDYILTGLSATIGIIIWDVVRTWYLADYLEKKLKRPCAKCGHIDK